MAADGCALYRPVRHARRRRRPTTSWASRRSWEEYGPSGKKKVFLGSNQRHRGRAKSRRRSFDIAFLRHEQENQRLWHVSLTDPTLVQLEVLNNPIGQQIRVLHRVAHAQDKARDDDDNDETCDEAAPVYEETKPRDCNPWVFARAHKTR
jgi:hypothetical protein